MSKNIFTIILVLVIGCGIVAFVFYIKARSPKYNWEAQYTNKSDQPYGLKCFFEILKEQKNGVSLINSNALNLIDTSVTNTNLIAIDTYIELDSLNISHLLNYIKRGNTVFLSTNEAQTYLMERILPKAGTMYGYDLYENSRVNVNLASKKLPYNEKLEFSHRYLKKITATNWAGYFQYYFDADLKPFNIVPISYINDTIINCFSIAHGRGNLILHSNPILFTNYNIIKRNGFKNANNILSYLNSGSIYWNDLQYSQNQTGDGAGTNPLKFLFSHYTLKTAWYLLLFSVLLFVLFRSKREQRIIPIIYKNKNTSIEFAKAIGSLYFQKKAHHNIANELYNIFLSEIRSRYNMTTNYKEDVLIDLIAKRTEINKEVVSDLFKDFSDVKYNVNATSKELVKLYKSIENFNAIKK